MKYEGFDLNAAQQSLNPRNDYTRVVIPMVGSKTGDYNTLPSSWTNSGNPVDVDLTGPTTLTDFKNACESATMPKPF